MPLRLPRLVSNTPIVDDTARPTGTFIQWWQQVVTQIEAAVGLIVELTGIQDEFDKRFTELVKTAQQAATDAQAAADQAKAAQQAAAKERALENSTIDPASVLTADPTTITIAPHTRRYADGTSVAVNGGTVTATAPGDIDYVYYLDPMRAGGDVNYAVSLNQQVQGNDLHNVGAVQIPETGTVDGGDGPRPPGWVLPRLDGNQPEQT